MSICMSHSLGVTIVSDPFRCLTQADLSIQGIFFSLVKKKQRVDLLSGIA